MLLMPRVTWERKRLSPVTTYRTSHIASDRDANAQPAVIADELGMTTLRTAAHWKWPSKQPERTWRADGGI